jgi:hypothetical protein
MNRALLSFAGVLLLPNPAGAQRFAGIIDATGMVARPTVSPTVNPVPGLPMLVSTATVFVPADRPGFFTPRSAPQVVTADVASQNGLVQTVFVPVPVAIAPSEVIEDVPVDAEALAAARSNARALSPPPRTPSAAFRGPTVFAAPAPAIGSSTGRCQTAALRQLRALNVRATDLRFAGNSTSMSLRGDATEVRGGGILQSDRGDWRRFRYVCADQGAAGETRAVVTFQ